MVISYGNFVASEIPNTTKQEILRDGVLYAYQLTPISEYVFHDNTEDYIYEDRLVRLYATNGCTCRANYDFSPSQITIEVRDENGDIVNEEVTAYGANEFFALLASKVPNPESEIFGVGNNNHEKI